MIDKTEIRARLAFKKEALQKARKAYLALLDGGAVQYAIGSRSLTKLDIEKLKKQIAALEKEIAELESLLAGGKRRKAIGIVPVDW